MPKESFLLRTDAVVLEALRQWASDELRSANGQLEFVLRRALAEAGRLKPAPASGTAGGAPARGERAGGRPGGKAKSAESAEVAGEQSTPPERSPGDAG
jgi:hypothetical protein